MEPMDLKIEGKISNYRYISTKSILPRPLCQKNESRISICQLYLCERKLKVEDI